MRLIALVVVALSASFVVLGQQRFDFKVREDVFAGMDGDQAALDRALKLIEETLSADPNHAEALVWRGDTRLFQAGQAFQRGAMAEGQALAVQGIADMDRAVSLAPDNIAVRVPRATGLLPFARAMRPFSRAEADRLTRTAIGDFEFVMAASMPWWNKLNEHGRGELLGALADGLLQLGEVDKARPYLDRMTGELARAGRDANATLAGTRADLREAAGEVVPEVRLLVSELREVTSSLRRFSGQLEQNPSLLLYGKPAPRPGPGE